MVNLMKMGLKAQQLQVEANAYTRIVDQDEEIAAVHEEAAAHNCFVWLKPYVRQAVISKTQPAGDDWIKCHPYSLAEFK